MKNEDQDMTDYNRLDRLVYLMEKKSREEYAVDKFKKRYDFKPESPGNTRGVITVDGERHRIDIGHNKLTKKSSAKNINTGNTVGDIDEPRMTETDLVSGEIALGREYFSRTKNQKRRDAILKHEIGHKKLHSDRKLIPISKTDEEKIQKAIDSGFKKNPNITKYADLPDEDAVKRNLKKEVEADIYGSKASNNKNMRKGLQDSLRFRSYVKSMASNKTARKKLNDMKNSKNTSKISYNKQRKRDEHLLRNDPDFKDQMYRYPKMVGDIRSSILKNRDIQNNERIGRHITKLKNKQKTRK